jgi:hypothetical protein
VSIQDTQERQESLRRRNRYALHAWPDADMTQRTFTTWQVVLVKIYSMFLIGYPFVDRVITGLKRTLKKLKKKDFPKAD